MGFPMPKKLDLQIKMGRNGRAIKITYGIHKIFIYLFIFRAKNNALICCLFLCKKSKSLTLPYTCAFVDFNKVVNRVVNRVGTPGWNTGLEPVTPAQ